MLCGAYQYRGSSEIIKMATASIAQQRQQRVSIVDIKSEDNGEKRVTLTTVMVTAWTYGAAS